VQPAPPIENDNLMVELTTGFRITPKNPDAAAQARLECSAGEGETLFFCSNGAEILRRRMISGNMELWVRRKNGDISVYLIGDGPGRTCRATRTVRARLSESVATERVSLDDKNCS
jgi:hypothetical protein